MVIVSRGIFVVSRYESLFTRYENMQNKANFVLAKNNVSSLITTS